jgi:hypothetical protein
MGLGKESFGRSGRRPVTLILRLVGVVAFLLGWAPAVSADASTGWSIQPSPSSFHGSGTLQSVSCAAATSCTAVGYYVGRAGYAQTLAES